MGRFLQPDPLGPSIRNPQTLNPYAYVLNNPLRYTDPTGMKWVADGGSGGGHLPPYIQCLHLCAEHPRGDYACSLIPGGHQRCYQVARPGGSTWPHPLDVAEAIPFFGIGDATSAVRFAKSCYDWPCDPWRAVGILPLVPGSGGKWLRSAFKHLDEAGQAGRAVTRSARGVDLAPHFKGGVASEVTLTEDLPVGRVYGGGADARARWWTTEAITDAAGARAGLALPDANLTTNVAEGLIPKGTTVYIGQAHGGWTQIFVDQPDVKNIIITGTRPLR